MTIFFWKIFSECVWQTKDLRYYTYFMRCDTYLMRYYTYFFVNKNCSCSSVVSLMRLAFILVITSFNKFLSAMFVNKLENLSGSCRMMFSWLMENPYNCSFRREAVHFSSQLRRINQPRYSATKRVPKQDGF